MKTNIPIFKIRCSAIHKIMAGEIGLTPTQQERLNDYQQREAGTHPKGLKLTQKMEVDMAELQYKKLNPELPEGAKTYCEQELGFYAHGRRPIVDSKYLRKGNIAEQEGITMMAVHLKLGMVRSSETFLENEFMTGTCDFDHPETDTVYDNKSSWEYNTFPMFKKEIPDEKYMMQVQGYMHLIGRKRAAVVYTLVDCPQSESDERLDLLRSEMKPWHDDNERQKRALNLIFTRKNWELAKRRFFPNADDCKFIEIPEKDRVKPFYFDYDPAFIADVQERVKLCRKYIQTLLNNGQSK
jgi:hypothetical protein